MCSSTCRACLFGPTFLWSLHSFAASASFVFVSPMSPCSCQSPVVLHVVWHVQLSWQPFEAISQTPLEPFPVYDVCNLAFVARCCKSLFCRKINDGPNGFAFLSISFDRRVHLLPVGFPVGTVACCGASPQTHTNMDEPESSSLQGSSEQSFSFSIYLCVALFAFEFPDISRPEFILTFEFQSGGSFPREAKWGGQSRGIPDYVMGVGTWRRLRMWKQADTVYRSRGKHRWMLWHR